MRSIHIDIIKKNFYFSKRLNIRLLYTLLPIGGSITKPILSSIDSIVSKYYPLTILLVKNYSHAFNYLHYIYLKKY